MHNMSEFKERACAIARGDTNKDWADSDALEDALLKMAALPGRKGQLADIGLRQIPRMREAILNPDPHNRERTVKHIKECIMAIIAAIRETA